MACTLNKCLLPITLILLCLFVCMPLVPLCEADVRSIVTHDIFEQFLSRRHDGSPCKTNFYNRANFLAAADAFPPFGTTGSPETQKREMAAFFAHVAHETGQGCYTDEVGNNDRYHGRGPIQLTGRGNYQAAGDYLHVDLVDNPDIVANDGIISFKTAIWFWMTQPTSSKTCHTTVINHQGFGPTTQIINGGECNSGNPDQQQDRVTKYQSFCGLLGISCTAQLYC